MDITVHVNNSNIIIAFADSHLLTTRIIQEKERRSNLSNVLRGYFTLHYNYIFNYVTAILIFDIKLIQQQSVSLEIDGANIGNSSETTCVDYYIVMKIWMLKYKA